MVFEVGFLISCFVSGSWKLDFTTGLWPCLTHSILYSKVSFSWEFTTVKGKREQFFVCLGLPMAAGEKEGGVAFVINKDHWKPVKVICNPNAG
ncbi:hypothetical protein AVEN_20903-1 [Araneus ventricosus]|uniref:Uncharacterized protein n=1 Tax=Araneus ventricosus TaxID=182803 RepID=A0A4Y2U781_ARAVE|nr:hypothetical protein AVEN_20903-1 [Araneus ventricosus]